MRWRAYLIAMLLLIGNFLPLSAFAELVVTAGQSEIVFNEASGTPVRWTVCLPDCEQGSARRSVLMDENDGYMRITTPLGPGGIFRADVEELADEVIVRFSAATEHYVYRVSRTRPRVILELPPQAGVQIATGAVFIPDQLPGFGQIYSRVKAVQVSEAGQVVYDDPEAGQSQIVAQTTNWTGIRNRYWALLVQPEVSSLNASIGLVELDRPVLTLSGGEPEEPTVIDLYAGPIEWDLLASVSPQLDEMLFAALWDFFRVLCFGMLLLLDGLYSLIGNYGAAIILLSLTVKLLMYPLTALADRWQADVNRIQTLLKPELDEIKRSYKGEEAHRLTLAVYKNHSVSPLYTIKSAAGFLIQIPVFIAAFDMLAENIALKQMTFLWIGDLAKPDALAELPFVIPFFGGVLNLLPFLMTGLSSLAAWLQSEDTLSPELQRQQSIRLYLMSAAFFILFYTFPAGMVLYWTSSNLFHLLKVESSRLFRRSA
jgi:YidC/Oxa1 family membrane protein insertase